MLDTDIFSEVTKRKNQSVILRSDQYFHEHGKFTVSLLTIFEVIYGVQYVHKDSKISEVITVFEEQEILPFTLECAILAGKITGLLDRTGQTIGKIDPMIAAIAISNDLPLATGNTKHYERIQKLGYPLKLENWK